MTQPEWIAVDWGTTRLRAWACSADGGTVATASSNRGMGSLVAGAFETALLELVSPWLVPGRITQVYACGMVGARQGWIEAPYREVPCVPLAAGLARAPVRDARLEVSIVPGLCQQTPADVMRGEETQIAGLLALAPGDSGVVCLPGTHSKWAEVETGRVIHFNTFMTGELFALLSQQSVLRHGLGDGDEEGGWDADAFDRAVGEGLERPEAAGGELFGIRAAGLLRKLASGAARARLSGLLIGVELAAARTFWDGHEVWMVGDRGLPALYAGALRGLGVEVRAFDAERVTLAGLIMARVKQQREVA